jgi:hypothetical protein
MFNQLFPQRVDNTYRGYKLALWLFGLLLFMKLAIGLNSIFNGYSVASSADGIPLDTYTTAGAQTVVSMFALLGLSHVVICLLGILVLIRYRSLIPFMFALLLLDYVGRKLIVYFLPIAKTGTPPGSIVSYVLLALILVGLALSMRNKDASQSGKRAPEPGR